MTIFRYWPGGNEFKFLTAKLDELLRLHRLVGQRVGADWEPPSIRPSVESQPSRLWLGTCRAGTKVSRRIALRSNNGSSIDIARLSSDPADFLTDSKILVRPDGTATVDLAFAISGAPGFGRAGLIITHREAGSPPLVGAPVGSGTHILGSAFLDGQVTISGGRADGRDP